MQAEGKHSEFLKMKVAEGKQSINLEDIRFTK